MDAKHPLDEIQIELLKSQIRQWGAEIKQWRENPENLEPKSAPDGHSCIPKDAARKLLHELKMNPSPRMMNLRASAVTEEDVRLGDKITEFLNKLTAHIYPVIQEEAADEKNLKIFATASEALQESAAKSGYDEVERKGNSTYWVVDPIDGTEQFIQPDKKKYGILIGMVSDGEPVFGMTYMPEFDLLQYVGADGKAYQQIGEGQPIELKVDPYTSSESTLNMSQETDKQVSNYTRIFRNTPLLGKLHKAIRVVEGVGKYIQSETADDVRLRNPEAASHFAAASQLYDEMGVLSGDADIAWLKGGYEWDYAGRHAILKAAGAELYDSKTSEPVRYNNYNTAMHGKNEVNTLYKNAAMAAHPDTVAALKLQEPTQSVGRAVA